MRYTSTPYSQSDDPHIFLPVCQRLTTAARQCISPPVLLPSKNFLFMLHVCSTSPSHPLAPNLNLLDSFSVPWNSVRYPVVLSSNPFLSFYYLALGGACVVLSLHHTTTRAVLWKTAVVVDDFGFELSRPVAFRRHTLDTRYYLGEGLLAC